MSRTAATPKRRRLAPEERRRIILAAAETVFAERGFVGASMDEVARQAGVTKPVVYDHFETKAALFFATAEGVRDELLRRGQSAATETDGEASFRAAIDAFFLFVQERPNAARVLFVTPKSDPIAGEAAAIVQAQARQAIAARLAPMLSGAPGREREAMVLFLQKGLHALAEAWLAQSAVPRKEMVDAVMALAWRGLQPRP